MLTRLKLTIISVISAISIIVPNIAFAESSDDAEFIVTDGEEQYMTGEIFQTDEEIIAELQENGLLIDEPVICSDDDLPEAVDNTELTDENGEAFFPEIGDQGRQGSCSAFARGYYQASYTFSKLLNKKIVFSPKFLYNVGKSYGSSDGMTASSTYTAMKKYGLLEWDDFEYNPKPDDVSVEFAELPTSYDLWEKALGYRIEGSSYISGISDIKKALADGDVLTFSTYVYSWEYTKTTDNEYIAYTRTTANEGSHAMTIVGYDDTIQIDTTIDGESIQMTGAFKVANSWGSSWKNDGYIWVAYDAVDSSSEYLTNHSGCTTIFTSAYKMIVSEENLGIPKIVARVSCDFDSRKGFSVSGTATSADVTSPSTTNLSTPMSTAATAAYEGVISFDYSDLYEAVEDDDDITYNITVNITSEDAAINEIVFVDKENESIIGKLVDVTAGQQYSVKPYYVQDDYENSDTSDWSLYGSGNISIDNDGNNNSLKFSYVSSSIRYYEYSRLFTAANSGDVIYTADVKFSMVDDGIYLKARNTDVNEIVARIRNVGGLLYYYTPSGGRAYMYYPNSNTWTRITNDKWYTVQFDVDFEDKVYDIYVIDKETNEIVGQITDLDFLTSDVDYINAFAVGSSNDMQVDNLRVYEPTLMGLTICGNTYQISSIDAYSTQYSVRGLAQCNEEFIDYTDFTDGEIAQWSLSDTDGTSVDNSDDMSDNGRVIFTKSSAKKIIIYATAGNFFASKVINAVI